MARRFTTVAAATLILGTSGTAALAQTGGVAPPRTTPTTRPAQVDPATHGAAPVVSDLNVTRKASPGPVDIRYRVDGPKDRVEIRLYMRRVGRPRERRVVRLGRRRTGSLHRYHWRNRRRPLRGPVEVKVWARDVLGRKTVRSAKLPGDAATAPVQAPVPEAKPAPPAVVVNGGSFPINGRYTYPSSGGGFGADRGDHVHQGQDLSAAEGTPLVAVVKGTIVWRRYQARGAGHYLVLRGRDGRDYVYMHMREGSLLVSEGQAVSAGQTIGQVGSTGRSSGAHLHFEVWEGPWFEGGKPVDPLPFLRAWERQRG